MSLYLKNDRDLSFMTNSGYFSATAMNIYFLIAWLSIGLSAL